jgi:hypothetical protein
MRLSVQPSGACQLLNVAPAGWARRESIVASFTIAPGYGLESSAV